MDPLWITTVSTGLLALLTGVYVFLTARLVKQNQRALEAQSMPQVTLSTSIHEAYIDIIDLVIQNVGAGPAYDVKFTLNRSHLPAAMANLHEIGIIKRGIKTLAPGQKFQFFLANAVEGFEELMEAPLEIIAAFADSRGRTYESSIVIDFSEFEEITRVGEPPAYKIAKSLERVQKSLEPVLKGRQRLHIVRYLEADLEAERETVTVWRLLRRLPRDQRDAVRLDIERRLGDPEDPGPHSGAV